MLSEKFKKHLFVTVIEFVILFVFMILDSLVFGEFITPSLILLFTYFTVMDKVVFAPILDENEELEKDYFNKP